MGLAGPARLSSGPLSSPKALSCSVDMQSSPKPSCQAEIAFRHLSSTCWAPFLPQSSASLLYANQQCRLDFPVSSQKPALPLCSASWLENSSSKNMWGLERWPPHALFSQRTHAVFPAPTLNGSQLHVTPAPGDPMPPLTSAGSGMPAVHTQTFRHVHAHIKLINKKN